jgi:glucokinase
MPAAYLAIEIGGTKLQVVLGGDSARILQRHRFNVARAQGAAGIRACIEAALVELSRHAGIKAVAVGFGGPVDSRTGTICRSHQIEGWADFELGTWLQRLTGAPVFIENDANMAALGEATHGAGIGFDPVFYITLGSGVGGGLVSEGRTYHGARPGEAEVGHLRLDRDGTILESRCSGWAVDAKIRALKGSGSSSVLCEWMDDAPGGEARHLARALEKGDAEAWRILNETAEDLAFGLSHVVHLFHPEVIVIGGGLSFVGEPLRAAIASVLPRFLMEVFAPGPELRLAALGEDAVTVGCLVAAHDLTRGALRAAAVTASDKVRR